MRKIERLRVEIRTETPTTYGQTLVSVSVRVHNLDHRIDLIVDDDDFASRFRMMMDNAYKAIMQTMVAYSDERAVDRDGRHYT